MIFNLAQRFSQDMYVFKYAADIFSDVSGSQIIADEKTTILTEFGFRGFVAVGCVILAQQDLNMNQKIGARFGFIPPLIMTVAALFSVLDGLDAAFVLFSLNIISQFIVVELPTYFNKNNTKI